MSNNNYQFSLPPQLTHNYPVVPPSYLPATGATVVSVSSNAALVPLAMAPDTSPWTEHVAQDGRVYYYNILTKQSTWDKPDELKTPAERILSQCPWKEFRAADSGKVYYYNSVTMQSVWHKPQELVDAEREAYGVASGAAVAVATGAPVTSGASEGALQGDTGATGAVQEAASAPVEAAQAPGGQDTTGTAGSEAARRETSDIDEAIKATLGAMGEHSGHGKRSDSNRADSSSDDESNETGTANLAHFIPIPEKVPTFRTKEELEEGWRTILRELNVPGNATWETAVKMISGDPRYAELKKYNQKKQVFNTYKTQRQKDEREEARLRIKRAKEDLEKFLLSHNKLSSAIGYRKADSLLSDCPEWVAVPERDRREIYEDALLQMGRREKEEAKLLRKRNIKLFNEILDVMPNLTYRTTWYEAQRILLENPRFVEDEDLQSMDKEDALICFEEHIRLLEKDHEEEKEREKRRLRRTQRKNREAFLVFLDELHEKNKLTSLSMWKDLYELISRDERFYKMLSQPGSTPLDLFKFYVLELKSRFTHEKKVIRDILEERRFTVETTTSLESFLKIIDMDERGRALDSGNVRIAYTGLLEKAESIEKQKKKEALRLQKKYESTFKLLLKVSDIKSNTSWEEVCEKLGSHEDFLSVELESDRMKYFKEYILSVAAVARSSRSRSKPSSQELLVGSSVPSKRKRKHRSNSRDSASSSQRKLRVDKPPKRKKKKQHSRGGDSSVDSRERNGGGGMSDEEARAKYKMHKKSKKKKKKRKHNIRQDSSTGDEMVQVRMRQQLHHQLPPPEPMDQRQPSEGELIDEDDIDPPIPHMHHQQQYHHHHSHSMYRNNSSMDHSHLPIGHGGISSSAEMSENELEAEKKKLLAELQN